MNISNLPEQAETTVKKTELATKLRPQNYREISELGATRRPTTVGKSYIWLACRGSCPAIPGVSSERPSTSATPPVPPHPSSRRRAPRPNLSLGSHPPLLPRPVRARLAPAPACLAPARAQTAARGVCAARRERSDQKGGQTRERDSAREPSRLPQAQAHRVSLDSAAAPAPRASSSRGRAGAAPARRRRANPGSCSSRTPAGPRCI